MSETRTTSSDYLIAIDPSLRSLGYAMFKKSKALVLAGVARPRLARITARSYHQRGVSLADDLWRYLEPVMTVKKSADIIIELPTNWFNERGMASKDNEAIQKLYYFVGALIGILYNKPNVHSIWGVTPMAWKGDVKKPIMVERAHRYLKNLGRDIDEKIPHDTCEALLLGRFAFSKRIDKTKRFTTKTTEMYDKPFDCIYDVKTFKSRTNTKFTDYILD